MQTNAAQRSVPGPARVLEVHGLKTHFFTRNGVVKAVDGVDLTLAEGEILGLVGESGSGKSITGFSLMGLLDEPGRIVGGDLRLNGEDLRAATPARWRQLRGQEIAMILRSVVLPQPEGPSRDVSSPRGKSTLTLSSACTPPG
jgi:peptide/nickel transport system ATP-binding protein